MRYAALALLFAGPLLALAQDSGCSDEAQTCENQAFDSAKCAEDENKANCEYYRGVAIVGCWTSICPTDGRVATVRAQLNQLCSAANKDGCGPTQVANAPGPSDSATKTDEESKTTTSEKEQPTATETQPDDSGKGDETTTTGPSETATASSSSSSSSRSSSGSSSSGSSSSDANSGAGAVAVPSFLHGSAAGLVGATAIALVAGLCVAL